MNEQRLAEIEARAEAATLGPWDKPYSGWLDGSQVRSENGEMIIYDEGGHSEADAEFIAHARQDIPDLVAEVRRLGKEYKESDEMVYALGKGMAEQMEQNSALRAQLTRIREAAEPVLNKILIWKAEDNTVGEIDQKLREDARALAEAIKEAA